MRGGGEELLATPKRPLTNSSLTVLPGGVCKTKNGSKGSGGEGSVEGMQAETLQLSLLALSLEREICLSFLAVSPFRVAGGGHLGS